MYEVREVELGWFHVGQIVESKWELHSFHDNESRAIRVMERLNGPDILELGGTELSQETTSIFPEPSAEGDLEITIINPRKGTEIVFPGLLSADSLLETFVVSPERFGEIWGDGEAQGMSLEDA